MSDKLELFQILFQKRNARKRGPTSSDAFNDMIDELAHDLAELSNQWNNRLVVLNSVLPNGYGTGGEGVYSTPSAATANQPDAFTDGLDGKTLYTNSRATSGTYYNTTTVRPTTVYEQFVDTYSTIATVKTDLETLITTNIPTASEISITDSGALYAASNVETALAEVKTEVDALVITANGVEVKEEGSSVGTAFTKINFVGDSITAVDAGSNEATITVSASGDVSKVGTPVNDQIAVWTGDGTIEGSSNLTFDSSNIAFVSEASNHATLSLKSPTSSYQSRIRFIDNVDDIAGAIGYLSSNGEIRIARGSSLITSSTPMITLGSTVTAYTSDTNNESHIFSIKANSGDAPMVFTSSSSNKFSFGYDESSDQIKIRTSTWSTGTTIFAIDRTGDNFAAFGTYLTNEQLTVAGRLSLKESTAPTATSGYGKVYTGTDSELHFLDDSGNDTQLTTAPSDAQLKTKIEPITNALSKVSKMNGVTFEWNELANEHSNRPLNKREIGLIAQDVEKVVPELVSEKKYKAIHYDKVTAVLVEAIKELTSKVEGLEEEVIKLKAPRKNKTKKVKTSKDN